MFKENKLLKRLFALAFSVIRSFSKSLCASVTLTSHVR